MRSADRWPIAIRMLYALCLAGAAYNHLRIALDHGLWWDYGGIPLFYQIFWTSLTFIDPLAVLLLLVQPRAGLVLTATIIVVDVLVNASATVVIGPDWQSLGAQMLFLAFVLATIGRAWPRRRET